MVGNTHSESTATGKAMTEAYHLAQKIVKNHVNADENDVIIFTGTGMTSAIAKLQRIVGLKVPEQAKKFCAITMSDNVKCSELKNKNRPVIFLNSY